MPISDKLIEQLLEGYDSIENILGEAGLLKQLTKKLAELYPVVYLDCLVVRSNGSGAVQNKSVFL